jgi:hypothetical protein
MNEPVLMVRPDDGPIGSKHVALYVLLMVITGVLDKNINTLFKQLFFARFLVYSPAYRYEVRKPNNQT